MGYQKVTVRPDGTGVLEFPVDHPDYYKAMELGEDSGMKVLSSSPLLSEPGYVEFKQNMFHFRMAISDIDSAGRYLRDFSKSYFDFNYADTIFTLRTKKTEPYRTEYPWNIYLNLEFDEPILDVTSEGIKTDWDKKNNSVGIYVKHKKALKGDQFQINVELKK